MKYVVSFLVILCTGTVYGSGSGSGGSRFPASNVDEFLQLIQKSEGIWREYDRKDLIPTVTQIVTPDTVMTTDKEGNSLVFWAASERDTESLSVLLECMDDSGAAQTLRGKALLEAVRKNYADCAELLLTRPVDTIVRARGDDCLLLGVETGAVEAVQAVINSKQACPFSTDRHARSPRDKVVEYAGNEGVLRDGYRAKCAQIAEMLGEYEQEHNEAGGCEHCRDIVRDE